VFKKSIFKAMSLLIFCTSFAPVRLAALPLMSAVESTELGSTAHEARSQSESENSEAQERGSSQTPGMRRPAPARQTPWRGNLPSFVGRDGSCQRFDPWRASQFARLLALRGYAPSFPGTRRSLPLRV
jgi:hypothetical protein